MKNEFLLTAEEYFKQFRITDGMSEEDKQEWPPEKEMVQMMEHYGDYVKSHTSERMIIKANNREEMLLKLFFKYKDTKDEEIREYLSRIKIVKKSDGSGVGSRKGYYPLKQRAIKKIMKKPRGVSLTFDAGETVLTPLRGLEEVKNVVYLVKSTSRFFLKPDIGEIFDAIHFLDLRKGGIDAICYNSGYETLENTDGEYHLMTVTLLKKKANEQRASN